jgi:hypothetical protein
VPDISEHNSEFEGEGDDGEHGGVDFTVSRGTIGVDDILESTG